MKRVLWVPADMQQEVKVVDLDGPGYSYFGGVKEGDIYRIGSMLHEQLGSALNNSTVWQEKVRTSFTNVFLMVDETGLLTEQPVNRRATLFYPNTDSRFMIRNDAYLCYAPVEYGEDGPDFVVQDMRDELQFKLAFLMNLAF